MHHRTTIDLSSLNLSFGDGKRLPLPVHLEPFELGGQTYAAVPEEVAARLEASRPSGGIALHLTFTAHLEGPCMRCLEPASVDVAVDAREVDQTDTDDEELKSPYVHDDELEIGRWAHDATILALPNQILCRPECLGLCPTCGEPLNDAAPGAHDHGGTRDPRWAALDALRDE